MQTHSPKNGPALQRKPNVSKGAGMPVLFCSKHAKLNFHCHKQCKDMYTAAVYRTLGATPGMPRYQSHKVDLLPTLQSSYARKGSKTGFCSGNVDSWGAGPGFRAHIHIHRPEAGSN